MAEDNSTIQQLRDQIKTLNSRVKELEPFEAEVQTHRRTQVLREVGFDPDSKQGALLLKVHEGELTVDALRATADEYGLNPPADTSGDQPAGLGGLPASTTDRIAAQRTIDEIRSQATPVAAGQKMSMQDFQTLASRDGAAATAAWANGQVDLPAHVSSQLAANKSTTPLGR